MLKKITGFFISNQTNNPYSVKQTKSVFLAVCFLSMFFISPFYSFSQVSDRIKLNQLGFYPNAPKAAVITGETLSKEFYITSTNLRDTFFAGTLSEEKQSAYSSTKTRIAIFSRLTNKGSFVVCVPGIGNSYIFEINNDVLKKAGIATLKGYYYQRASMPLEEKYAGKWHRSSGHPDNVVYIHPSAATKARPAGTIISTPGGWYDAGDYNKYIVNSGISMGTLLSAYEDFPDYFKQLKTNIPESDNGVPDILNEVIYNLRWMLTMQDPGDGGVYNKCTNAVFDGMVMPGVTQARRYVVQKGTAATLDFAAVTAQAIRILSKYKKQLPGLSDSCIAAAKKAWEWALLNPALEYDQAAMNRAFKPEITTGPYGDKNFDDEWLWAAAECYISTKEKKYFEVVEKHLNESVLLPSWSNVAMLGYYSFLRFGNAFPPYTVVDIKRMKDKVINIANGYIEKVADNAFTTVMGQSSKDFNWGGNANAANQGILLIRAFLLTGDKKYVDYALTNLDYLLGKNATGYCFITGIGSKSPMHPHHRQSISDGVTEPVPGLVVAGPNPGMQDSCKYEFTEPETAYLDSAPAYASNEIAINWNAPFVYLANAVEALQSQIGYSGEK
ncbi:MAG: glycoside hydrolase family 9 protein [Bacteroidota bacterium]|nr:glycoside hydrolase family 9 protein [Bacteroidota bacterium]